MREIKMITDYEIKLGQELDEIKYHAKKVKDSIEKQEQTLDDLKEQYGYLEDWLSDLEINIDKLNKEIYGEPYKKDE